MGTFFFESKTSRQRRGDAVEETNVPGVVDFRSTSGESGVGCHGLALVANPHNLHAIPSRDARYARRRTNNAIRHQGTREDEQL